MMRNLLRDRWRVWLPSALLVMVAASQIVLALFYGEIPWAAAMLRLSS